MQTYGAFSLDARTLFARHLDLSGLRGDQGLVRCIFHRDRSPSLSVNLADGIVHCFACGKAGGVRRFAELVGEGGAASEKPSRESVLQQARRRVMEAERRRRTRMGEWSSYLRAMVWLRRQERAIAAVRANATDDPAGWDALDDAATLERFVELRSAEIEGLLAVGRCA